jgi:hypothetical protein
MKFTVTLNCESPTENWLELASAFAIEDFDEFREAHLVSIEGASIRRGYDADLDDLRKEE